MTFLESIFSTSGLQPHGFCLLWQPSLLYLHVLSDSIIGIAYYSIPLALGYFVWQRRDIAFGFIFWLFAAFILACGTTHFIEVWTLWHPDYGIQGLVKALTATISIITALFLWPLIPKALALPSPAQLHSANAALQSEIAEKEKVVEALRHETAERAKAEEMLRHAQKMEAIGQLTGGIAHDFNNLLAIVVGSLEAIQRRAGQNSPLDQYIENAMQGVERGVGLTRQLLAFARRQSLDAVPLDANELVRSLSDLLQRTLGSRVQLEKRLADDLWTAYADYNQLESAILNLAINARDAMPDGGTLTIETSMIALDKKQAKEWEVSPGDYVAISLSDTGSGMNPETLARAFEPFFTTKRPGHGTGLGLSQVYGFATQSKGTVRIASEVGVGTRVTLYLLRSFETPVGVAEIDPQTTPSHAQSGDVILLAEDNENLRALTQGALEELDYKVHGASNGRQALETLVANPEIRLLITDLDMPEMNGAELAKAARLSRPELPIIIVTGYAKAMIDHDITSRIDAKVLLKPTSFQKLANTIREILETSALNV